MKEGWTYKKIKEVGDVIGGTTPSTSNPSFWGGDICWISPAELHGEHYLYDSVKKITKEAVEAKSLKELPVGTVILSSRAPIGKIAINKVPMYCNQGFKCIVCKSELYNEYLYWWLYGKKDYLNSLGTGATFPEISKTVVENIVIPIAPLDEQQRIVSRLDSAFSQIDELKANAEKQFNEAKALFQKALAEEMKPKERWEEAPLVDVFNFIDYRGATPTKINDGVPLVTAKNVKYGYIDYTIKEYISREEYETRKNRGVSRKGDILFTTEAPLGNVAIADLDEFSAGQRLITLQQYVNSQHKIDNKFFFYYMLSPRFQNRIKDLATGATAQGIKARILKTIIVPLPPLSEQQAIVSRLDTLSSQVRDLEENCRKTIAECDALKQAMLREVFE